MTLENLDITEDALLQALMAAEPGPANNPVGAMTTKQLRAVTGWSIQRVRDRLRELMAAGRVDMTGVATATFPLDRALDAIVETSKRTGGKILVQAAPTP